jgi:type IV pilus assembly protein PilA
MSEESDTLARTRPLADPLRVITILTAVSAAFLGVVTWPASGIWAALGIACSMLSFALLIAPGGKPNAIYLRAFRTDKSSAKLRGELAAILGPGFRLSGIRPPKEKSSIFVRFLLPGIVALRYAGSKFMELEAGDDWMARLWKTYQTTRLVLIDVREVTPYVHQEIEMTLESVGVSRCVFIVNEGKTEVEWRQLLAEIVGPENDDKQLQLLDVSPAHVSSRQVESDLKEIMRRLPAGVPGDLVEGRRFVLEHVSKELLKKSRRPSAMTVIGAVSALGLSAGFGVVWSIVPHENPLLLGLVWALVLSVFLLWFGSLCRLIARAERLRRAGHSRAAIRSWSASLAVLVLFAAGPALNVMQAASGADAPLVRIRKAANEASAIASIRTLNTAEVIYATSYPSKGFACPLAALGGDPNTGGPSADGAQLISDELASGQKSGYTFRISNCDQNQVNGHGTYTSYRITAVPSAAGKTRERGFCSDESGAIRYDPGGGTNCAAMVQ